MEETAEQKETAILEEMKETAVRDIAGYVSKNGNNKCGNNKCGQSFLVSLSRL
ncbi:hypothetical protein FH972_024780 [Carpinus fangiana]|uniref:Uncharacterized protein n=1 Tax=Carpinus fangiana TaxID=176857 RepID=A0A5N6KZW0_9ROSI|nr:hypothetical protein FH972_024780 [Carpinus fangiana]